MIPVLPPGCSQPRGNESASWFSGCLGCLVALGFILGGCLIVRDIIWFFQHVRID